jgi:hypothetical protein
MGERKVVVLSSDGNVRGHVEAAVAATPGVRTVFLTWDGIAAWRPRGSDRVFVIDDEEHEGAERLVQDLHARNRDAQIVYLAAHHSQGLERMVRRAGAAWYAVKPARGRDLERVIGALLRT